MSTSQRAVMLCRWGVKAGIAFLQVNCVSVAISHLLSALENAIVFKGALQMSTFTLRTGRKVLTARTYGCRKCTRDRSFTVAGPRLWNNLQATLTDLRTV